MLFFSKSPYLFYFNSSTIFKIVSSVRFAMTTILSSLRVKRSNPFVQRLRKKKFELFPHVSIKIVKFSVLLIILTAFISCTKVKREYYKDGTIQSEVTYKGGKKNGIAVYYHENGKKSLELVYKDDMVEGASMHWFYKGTIKRTDNYKNNKLNGISTNWEEELGCKFSEETYVNDTMNGAYKEYHPNGELKVTGNYKKGKFDGIWIYYDERGIPVGEGKYKNGEGILVAYYPNGKKMREVNYADNKKNGKETLWLENGQIEKIIYNKEDRIEKIETLTEIN